MQTREKMDRQNCLWRKLSRLALCLNMKRGAGFGHMESHALGNTLKLLISKSGSSVTQVLLLWTSLRLWAPPSFQYSLSSCCPPLAAHEGHPSSNTCQNQINSLVNSENNHIWHSKNARFQTSPIILTGHNFKALWKVGKSRWHISDYPDAESI